MLAPFGQTVTGLGVCYFFGPLDRGFEIGLLYLAWRGYFRILGEFGSNRIVLFEHAKTLKFLDARKIVRRLNKHPDRVN